MASFECVQNPFFSISSSCSPLLARVFFFSQFLSSCIYRLYIYTQYPNSLVIRRNNGPIYFQKGSTCVRNRINLSRRNYKKPYIKTKTLYPTCIIGPFAFQLLYIVRCLIQVRWQGMVMLKRERDLFRSKKGSCSSSTLLSSI